MISLRFRESGSSYVFFEFLRQDLTSDGHVGGRWDCKAQQQGGQSADQRASVHARFWCYEPHQYPQDSVNDQLAAFGPDHVSDPCGHACPCKHPPLAFLCAPEQEQQTRRQEQHVGPVSQCVASKVRRIGQDDEDRNRPEASPGPDQQLADEIQRDQCKHSAQQSHALRRVCPGKRRRGDPEGRGELLGRKDQKGVSEKKSFDHVQRLARKPLSQLDIRHPVLGNQNTGGNPPNPNGRGGKDENKQVDDIIPAFRVFRV